MAATKMHREAQTAVDIVPSGMLKHLSTKDIKPSANNPRRLFDPQPLQELQQNIKQHGVLVPITVFQIRGQNKFAILDGERRYHCCVELEKEGLHLTLPANVVEPPTKIAGLLYMFSIHNFREAWELMPTALSLGVVMKELDEEDNERLSRLTGLSTPQIERCKKLLAFPERYQKKSLDPDPTTRIPANFWIEAAPVLDLCKELLPKLYAKLGEWGVLDQLVKKYEAKRIKSVIHFRRIMEASELAESAEHRAKIAKRLEEYITDVELETRKAFDEFVVDNRRIANAIGACEEFITRLEKAKLDFAVDRDALRAALKRVIKFADRLLNRLAGSDAPTAKREAE